MKKNKLFIIFTIFILFLGIIYKPILIKADSGFDSSFGGSSSSSGSSSSGSGGSLINDNIKIESPEDALWVLSLILLITAIYILIAYIITKIHNFLVRNRKIKKIVSKIFTSIILIISFYLLSKSSILLAIIAISIIILILTIKPKIFNLIHKIPNKLSENNIYTKLPNLDIDEFNNMVFNNYKAIQIAWMNFALNDIRNLISDEIYNMYNMQLETLKTKGQTNKMEDIEYIDNYISDIKTENDVTTITTILQVTCYDYLIDNNNKVIKGNKFAKLKYTYALTFTRNNKKNNLNICPNCGATIQINSSEKCEYCNSTFINNESSWIMTKKQMLNQKEV